MGRAGELGDVAATSGALSDISKTSTGLTKDLDGLKVDVPKTDPLPGGRPVAPPAPKPFEAPVEPTPRPVESAPPGTSAPHSPTAPGPGRPEPSVVPHEPAPVSAGGPREPVSMPAAPGERQPTSAAVQSPQEAPALASATSPRRPHTCPRVPLRRSCQRQVVEAGTDLVTAGLWVAVRIRLHRTRVGRTGLATGALVMVAQAGCPLTKVCPKRRLMETVRIRPAMEVRQAVGIRIPYIPTSPLAMDGIDYQMDRLTRITANPCRSIGTLQIIQPIQVTSSRRLRTD